MERLQKVIANSGYCSRRKAEELISAGKVTVNGVVTSELGIKVGPYDKIAINNKPLQNINREKVYIMLNKPRNCVSTMSDPQHRRTVLSYIQGISQRIYPVGRLDYDTSGLLLLTNDGDFANIITHPSHVVDKTYHVLINGAISKTELQQLARGVEIEPGIISSPATVKLLNYADKTNNAVVSLTIHEGKKHQVKRMLSAVGKEVLKLKRVAIAFLELDETLRPGEWRHLKPKEVKRFFGLGVIAKPKNN
ncbi:pseudouridine synthase [Spiroplasma chrysopicola]|uniref:Pseudouridine synthase n=1 Tax=Spiroplasma chrysopicola DF-1 TaxID=1276227 RepID=R4U381_9MOLU|nr:pseudouridine synthase [Spiroplasma chrysopicola]AGM24953.1 ribosomal large subunit pseudouridine synthase B [Spiroplasma chrysopicola DF-1]